MNINTEAGDGAAAPKSTPRKRATPSKAKKSIKAEVSGGSDDDEDFDTPSKKQKTAMNKVKDGRITKPRGKTAVTTYAENDDDEDDMAVKGGDAIGTLLHLFPTKHTTNSSQKTTISRTATAIPTITSTMKLATVSTTKRPSTTLPRMSKPRFNLALLTPHIFESKIDLAESLRIKPDLVSLT